MIGRVWHGVSLVADADAYVAHLRHATLPALKTIAGHRGSYVLRRDRDGAVEFVVITLWDSLEAVRSFAGDDPEVAVVPAEARRLLTEYDERAVHYEVALERWPVNLVLAELDPIVTDAAERATRRGHIGLVVGVIAGDEQVVKGLGRARDDSAEPPNGQTIFDIGSITKAFTGLLLAEMARAGLVALDDGLNEFTVPQFDAFIRRTLPLEESQATR